MTTNAKVYPVTARLEARLKDIRRGTAPAVKTAIDMAVEFIGECEHDPSLRWPELYENVGAMTDAYVDGELRREVDRRLNAEADALIEFLGYMAASDELND